MILFMMNIVESLAVCALIFGGLLCSGKKRDEID